MTTDKEDLFIWDEILTSEGAKQKFSDLIKWMRQVADEKMRTEEGREWLRKEWNIKVP